MSHSLRGTAKTDDGHVTLAPCEVDDIVDRVKVIKGRLAKGEQVGTLGGRGWLDENDTGGVVQYLGRKRMVR